MSTARRSVPAIWLWGVATMLAPRGPRGAGRRDPGAPALELHLPADWSLVRAAALPAPTGATLSRATRSSVCTLTWNEQPLTRVR